MRVALDTNCYVGFCRGEEYPMKVMQTAHELLLPFVVLGELRAGFACGNRTAQNANTLTRFLNKPRVKVLYPDDGTTHHYANLFKQLRQQGTPIPTNDLWIAALCVQHGLLLATSDGHFDHLPQIPRYH
ncbi:MAG: type II toxin-antitoxin system VapC family toxin [Deltaproteobacteria bacterium]|nr:type II toxin-antitoxin system VapC family toxin [Deltaproteobacteria bacterium]